MSFREIIAEVPNLTEDEKRQLLDLLERELSENGDEESPEFLAMLERRINAADKGGRTHTLAQAREAMKKSVRRPSR
jgi:hypothetical protein